MAFFESTADSKLIKVFHFLEQDQKECERIYKAMEDREFKKLFSQLADMELIFSQLLFLRLSDKIQYESNGKEGTGIDKNKSDKDRVSCNKKFFENCCHREKELSDLYKNAINSCRSQQELRKMLKGQLNEIKIKFLNIRIRYMITVGILSPHDLRKK